MTKRIATALLERVFGRPPAAKAADPAKDALEREKLHHEIRKLTAEADMAEQEQELRREARLLREDTQRVISFNDSVQCVSVGVCKKKLAALARLERTAPIEIVFNSPGGSVFEGLDLYDTIMKLRSEGTPINTTVLGMGASMAGILLQAGERRRIGESALLMVHEVSSFSIGKLSSMEDDMDLSKRLYDRCIGILAARSLSSGCTEPLTAEQIKAKAYRKDWWLSADEALKHGLVDGILPVVASA
jgi:ATP-dependent Clp protease protease subunit